MLRAILGQIGETNRQFVEIGFNDNEQCVGSGSNTCLLWRLGWTGLLLDGAHSNASINLHAELLSADNVVDVLRRHHVPSAVDFLSIDVDSVDVWLLDSILSAGFRPRVIAIEYNSNYPWSYALAFPRKSKFSRLQHEAHGKFRANCYYGSAPRALDMVGRAHDYSLVAVVPELDLIFVPSELEPCAMRGLYTARDAEGSVGRYARDQWRTALLLNASHSLNTYNGREMEREQAAELIDWGVWRQHVEAGASTDAAEAAARNAARPQVMEMAHAGLPCFRRLGRHGDRTSSDGVRASANGKSPPQQDGKLSKTVHPPNAIGLNLKAIPHELRPRSQWQHTLTWMRKTMEPRRWLDWVAFKARLEARRQSNLPPTLTWQENTALERTCRAHMCHMWAVMEAKHAMHSDPAFPMIVPRAGEDRSRLQGAGVASGDSHHAPRVSWRITLVLPPSCGYRAGPKLPCTLVTKPDNYVCIPTL